MSRSPLSKYKVNKNAFSVVSLHDPPDEINGVLANQEPFGAIGSIGAFAANSLWPSSDYRPISESF